MPQRQHNKIKREIIQTIIKNYLRISLKLLKQQIQKAHNSLPFLICCLDMFPIFSKLQTTNKILGYVDMYTYVLLSDNIMLVLAKDVY